MNILIPHKWLLEHLNTQATPEKIQETLSLCGPSVERIENILEDAVYDIEVTTNRVDSASVRGIAREAATILPEFNIEAQLKPLNFDQVNQENINQLPPLDLQIQNNLKLCDRIMAISMQVDQVGQSPKWLQDRLIQVGQRPLNILIDITNYVMWELGHPIHVFDLDKLAQKRIIVRQAKKGEILTTLDNKIHTLNGAEVVFDDGSGLIVDLPGIMGTANSVVSESTKNILVWIESIPAHLIRHASMGLAIRTQAAVLNEKHVDPALGEATLLRAIQLYQELAKARATSNIYNDWPNKADKKEIQIDHQIIETYLGIVLPSQRVVGILEKLGFEVNTKLTGDNSDHQSIEYTVTPPTGRTHDIEIKQDIIEEIARIYGYHNLPSKLMDTAIPEISSNSNYHKEAEIKSRLASWGGHEVYTYSLVSEKLAQDADPNLAATLALANSLTTDMTHLRTSIIPSHSLVFNENQINKNLIIFEMANTYHPKSEDKLPQERLDLVISTNGKYIQLKQLLDNLVYFLRIENLVISPQEDSQSSLFQNNLWAKIRVEDTLLGLIGKTEYGFYSCQLDVHKLINFSKSHPTYQPIAKTSAITEDLTFTLPKNTYIGQVVSAVKQSNSKIETVTLKSTYQQNYTFGISYLDRDSQLSSQDIIPVRDQLISILSDKFQAKLVGQV